jgi:glycosyltransferase involved in cell wall biosynthesis
MASGDYLGVLDHDDELDTLTLFEYVRTINEHPDADCIYCDEDKINEQGKYCDPWFKSNWNPVLVIRVKICRTLFFFFTGQSLRTRPHFSITCATNLQRTKVILCLLRLPVRCTQTGFFAAI